MRVIPSSPTSIGGRAARPPTVGVLSTYPPTACGLATFSAALAAGLRAHGADVRVVRVGAESTNTRPEVQASLIEGSRTSIVETAAALNGCDVAIVQHEYGMYGGADGDDVLAVLHALDVPTVVVAHTVLREPTPHQRSVLAEVAQVATRIVVMSEAARTRLLTGFDAEPAKVVTIPHGAVVPAGGAAPRIEEATLLTWGLLGPGKGIERVIDALADLQDLRPHPRYLVAGRTHPKVLASDGDAYRNARISQARRVGVASSIAFDSTYRDVPSLTALIRSAALVVLPYDSTDQATSGVLVDAVAAGRPVVATAFPHAVELLGSGAGIVVDHDDPDALARALRRVLTEPGLAAEMATEATRIAPTMGWPIVAAAYLDLASDLLSERPAFV